MSFRHLSPRMLSFAWTPVQSNLDATPSHYAQFGLGIEARESNVFLDALRNNEICKNCNFGKQTPEECIHLRPDRAPF